MKLFRRLLCPTLPVREKLIFSSEIQEWLVQRNLNCLQQWLQGECGRTKNTTLLPDLLGAMQAAGWPEQDRNKIALFAHMAAGCYPEAIEMARALKASADPVDAEVLFIEANSLFHCNAFDEAWQVLLKAYEHLPRWEDRIDFLEIAILLGSVVGDDAMTLRFLNRARELAPDHQNIALNGYGIYFEQGEMNAFSKIETEIEAGKYDLREAALAMAYVKLAQGRYAEGWRVHEGRYQMSEAGRYFNPVLLDYSRWQGEPLSGRTLLISCEQGLGDTVMMARYFPHLAESAAMHIIVETQPELITLLEHNLPNLRFLPRRHGQLPDCVFDCWCGSMSLPFFFNTRVDTVPQRGRYLTVPAETERYWRARVAELSNGRQPRIGLAWSGARTHRADRRRSIPFGQIYDAVHSQEADFFALQKETPPDVPPNLHVVSDELLSLADTAALIAQMDLVITVDSSPVHLAGALGKAAWLLLPYRYEWRWGLEGEENPWYASVRVMRQASPGDWQTVIDRVFGECLVAWRRQWQAN